MDDAQRVAQWLVRLYQEITDASEGPPGRAADDANHDEVASAMTALLDEGAVGLELATSLLHRTCWAQALPAANHRTAIAATQRALGHAGIHIPPPGLSCEDHLRWALAASAFIEQSKRLIIAQDEQSHRQHCQAWLKAGSPPDTDWQVFDQGVLLSAT